jgi:hypothetical protein
MGDESTWRTDKVMLGYAPTYRTLAVRLDAVMQRHPLKVLEIGVAGGAGLEMLQDIFELPLIWGVDLNSTAELEATVARSGHRMKVLIEHQDSPELQAQLMRHTDAPAAWDLIVDDASHRAVETAATLANMWPHVRHGGYYVIEDWNYFQGPAMFQILWQRLFGWKIDWNNTEGYSGMMSDVESVYVRSGMLVIEKLAGEEIPKHP